MNVLAMATYEPTYTATGNTESFVLGIVDRIIVVFPYDGGELKISIGLKHNHQRYFVFVRSCALERIRTTGDLRDANITAVTNVTAYPTAMRVCGARYHADYSRQGDTAIFSSDMWHYTSSASVGTIKLAFFYSASDFTEPRVGRIPCANNLPPKKRELMSVVSDACADNKMTHTAAAVTPGGAPRFGPPFKPADSVIWRSANGDVPAVVTSYDAEQGLCYIFHSGNMYTHSVPVGDLFAASNT